MVDMMVLKLKLIFQIFLKTEHNVLTSKWFSYFWRKKNSLTSMVALENYNHETQHTLKTSCFCLFFILFRRYNISNCPLQLQTATWILRWHFSHVVAQFNWEQKPNTITMYSHDCVQFRKYIWRDDNFFYDDTKWRIDWELCEAINPKKFPTTTIIDLDDSVKI